MKKVICAAALMIILTAKLAFGLTEGNEYFVNTALHVVDGDEIYWVNHTAKSVLIKAGTRVKIKAITGHKIAFELKGKKYNFAFTEKGTQGSDEFYSKFFTEKDINSEIDAYPEDIKGNIKKGKAEKGMTKEQVLRAVGCPAIIEDRQKTFDLTLKEIMESDKWIFYYTKFNRWQVEFKDGKLVDIKD